MKIEKELRKTKGMGRKKEEKNWEKRRKNREKKGNKEKNKAYQANDVSPSNKKAWINHAMYRLEIDRWTNPLMEFKDTSKSIKEIAYKFKQQKSLEIDAMNKKWDAWHMLLVVARAIERPIQWQLFIYPWLRS